MTRRVCSYCMLVAFIFKRSTRTHPDLFKFEHSLSQIFHLTRYVLLLCKGAAIAAALVDQLMADVDSLSMSSIVPGSLRKSLYTIFPTYFEWPSVCFTDCSFLPGLFHKLKSFIFNSFFFCTSSQCRRPRWIPVTLGNSMS